MEYKPEWRAVLGFDGRYEVSNEGGLRVLGRTINNKFVLYKEPKLLKNSVSDSGYIVNTLTGTKEGRKVTQVHRLVAKAFIPNIDNLPQVNHIDGVKTNNHVSNLEWITSKDNVIHAYQLGLINVKRGGEHHASVIDDEEVVNIFKLNQEGNSALAIAKTYGVSKNTILRVLNRKNREYVDVGDMKFKKRYAKVKKITTEIEELIKIDLKSGMSGRSIAVKYDISEGSVSMIKNNKQRRDYKNKQI